MQERQERDKSFLFAKENRIYLSCMEHCFKNFSTELKDEEKVCLLKCNDRKSDLLSANFELYKKLILMNHTSPN